MNEGISLNKDDDKKNNVEIKEEVKKFNMKDADLVDRLGRLRGTPLSETEAMYLSERHYMTDSFVEFYLGGEVGKINIQKNGNIYLGHDASNEIINKAKEMGMIYERPN